MSDIYTIQKSTLDNIAEAIREKTGGTSPINPTDMDDEIRNIEADLETVIANAGDDVYRYLDSYEVKSYYNFYDDNDVREKAYDFLDYDEVKDYYNFYDDNDVLENPSQWGFVYGATTSDTLYLDASYENGNISVQLNDRLLGSVGSDGRGYWYDNISLSFPETLYTEEDVRNQDISYWYSRSDAASAFGLYDEADVTNQGISYFFSEDDAKNEWGLISPDESYSIDDNNTDRDISIAPTGYVDDYEIFFYSDSDLYKLESDNSFVLKSTFRVDIDQVISALESAGYTVTRD